MQSYNGEIDLQKALEIMNQNWVGRQITRDGEFVGKITDFFISKRLSDESPSTTKFDLQYISEKGIIIILRDIDMLESFYITESEIVFEQDDKTVQILMASDPCPLCGRATKIICRESYNRNDDPVEDYEVACTDKECYLCEGAHYEFSSASEAITEWNIAMRSRKPFPKVKEEGK